MLAELHADADFEQRSRRQTKLCHTSCWKLISFSLCKYQPTIAANRNLKSCLSIGCLAPHHILQLFLFLPRFWPLPSATMLIVMSFSSMFHWAMEIKKRKRFCNELLLPGNLDLSSLTLEGQFCSCCGIRYPINSIKEPSAVSRIIGFLKEKSLKLYIYRNLHLLSFPLMSSLPGFYRNKGVYEFFPEGHPRRWEVTLGLLFVLTTVAFLS